MKDFRSGSDSLANMAPSRKHSVGSDNPNSQNSSNRKKSDDNSSPSRNDRSAGGSGWGPCKDKKSFMDMHFR